MTVRLRTLKLSQNFCRSSTPCTHFKIGLPLVGVEFRFGFETSPGAKKVKNIQRKDGCGSSDFLNGTHDRGSDEA
jgi:hypothetical protein